MRIITLACALLLLFALPARADVVHLPLVQAQGGDLATLDRVIDGDTIDVLLDGEVVRVRYIGMDTPERGDCFYADAKAYNATLVTDRALRLVRDVSETDRYGRLLRYVYSDAGQVNGALVRDGYARPYRYPPDVACSPWFDALAVEAQGANVGGWASCGWQP